MSVGYLATLAPVLADGQCELIIQPSARTIVPSQSSIHRVHQAYKVSLEQAIEQLAPQRLVVAFSGGMDSSVLLDVAIAMRGDLPLVAVHINHQLSPNASVWARHCTAHAAAYGIQCHQFEVEVRAQGEGVEASARQARYQVFEKFLQAGDLLLQGHHADDQVETFLQRLMRGAGLRGLAGIPVSRVLGRGHLWRPLLSLSRDQFSDYAQTRGLTWILDESNACTDFDRNYLRHEVVPALRARWPEVSARVTATTQLCADAEALLSAVADEDLATLACERTHFGQRLRLQGFTALSAARQIGVLRHWCRLLALDIPARAHWHEVQAQLVDAGRADSLACVRWGNAELRRYQGWLYLLSQQHAQVDPTAIKGFNGLSVELPDAAAVTLKQQQKGPGRLKAYAIDELSLRWRQGGERCRPVWRQRSQTLKKLFQEVALEPWLRDRVPLVYRGEELVAVGDLWVCAGHDAPDGELGYQINWHIHTPANNDFSMF